MLVDADRLAITILKLAKKDEIVTFSLGIISKMFLMKLEEEKEQG